jgi:hypothetical protein
VAISTPIPEGLAVNFVNLSPLAVLEAQPQVGVPGCSPPQQVKRKRKKKQDTHKFCRHDDIKLLRDLPFGRNQSLKSGDNLVYLNFEK